VPKVARKFRILASLVLLTFIILLDRRAPMCWFAAQGRIASFFADNVGVDQVLQHYKTKWGAFGQVAVR
jgi:hypothetical protein